MTDMTTNPSAQQSIDQLLKQIATTDHMLQQLDRAMAEYKSRTTPYRFRCGNAERQS
jgi:hypothetical protein